MKKSIIAITLALLLAVSAAAHPGATDSRGGHTDHSTGEYHYHHGYPAHQHYDMNGDGRADCPYKFDDKTGQSSGGSSYQFSNSESGITTPTDAEPTDAEPTDSVATGYHQEADHPSTFDNIVAAILFVTFTSLFILFVLMSSWLAIFDTPHSRQRGVAQNITNAFRSIYALEFCLWCAIPPISVFVAAEYVSTFSPKFGSALFTIGIWGDAVLLITFIFNTIRRKRKERRK